MTVEERFIQMLYARGVGEDTCKAIMAEAKPIVDAQSASMTDGYTLSWESDAADYPDALYNVFFNMYIGKAAQDWAARNKPMAWWRGVFNEH